MRGTMGLYGLWPVVCFWAFCLEQATAGVLKPVSGPEDLNLTGTIYYGINLGGTSDVLVGGKWLESDNDGDPAPVGYTITLPTNIYTSGWGYGSLTDPGLQKTYDSMRWTGWPNALELSFRYLPPGQPVRVQLLLSEGYHNSSQRRFDIQIEGNTEFSNVDPWSLWGYKNPGLAETVVTVSQDGILNVRLIGNVGAPDKNPVLDGIFVSSAEPIVPSWPRVQPVSVTASAQYSSQYPATAVLDGSWAERRPPEYPVADYWLLPNGQTGYLTFDMGQPVHLAMIGLHNTNNAQYGDRGTIAYHIDVSSDPNFTTYETLAAGTLQAYAAGWAYIPISTNQLWQYVRFYVDDFGGTRSFLGEMPWSGGGLAEILFYAVPEPTSWLLMALGGVALGWLGWRQQKTSSQKRATMSSAPWRR